MATRTIVAVALLTVSVVAKESVHLVNCFDGKSQMYYYSNDGNRAPDDYTVVSSNGVVHWEGQPVHGYFSDSGVTFTSNINANAASYPDGHYAGSGTNGRAFDCFKDDGHTINATPCNSIYYCFDAAT